MSLIRVEGLSQTFYQAGERIDVLQNLSLDVAEGETIAIVGQSGSGKSTLLALLAGLDRPVSGSIVVAGCDMVSLDEAALAEFRAKTLGIVFQQFHLMSHLTALENAALPLEILNDKQATPKAEEALGQVGLAARTRHFPRQLSGGERQRLAIARAFVTRPKLLLADEPSGNLDVHTGEQVMNLLFESAGRHKTTMILVTHNEDLARRCTRRLVLQDGRLH